MTYGCMKAIAECYMGENPALRLLVTVENNDWQYLYIGATNYQFCEEDLVSWDNENFNWLMQDHQVSFPLLRTAAIIL